VADGQAVARVEELQVAGVDGQLERLSVLDQALLGHPGCTQGLAATRAAEASSSSAAASADWVRLVCSKCGASMVKITFMSLPSSSVTPATTRIVPRSALPRLASSKSDGRMPTMTLLPKYSVSLGLACRTSAGTGSL
jgi:hypothetical protein